MLGLSRTCVPHTLESSEPPSMFPCFEGWRTHKPAPQTNKDFSCKSLALFFPFRTFPSFLLHTIVSQRKSSCWSFPLIIRSLVAMWLVCGWSLVGLWSVFGQSLVGLWLVSGWSLVGLWAVFGRSWVGLGSVFGWSLFGLWLVCGCCLIGVWLVFGQSLVGLWLVFGWSRVGLCLVFGWSLVGHRLVCGWSLVGLWLVFGWSPVGLWSVFGWSWVCSETFAVANLWKRSTLYHWDPLWQTFHTLLVNIHIIYKSQACQKIQFCNVCQNSISVNVKTCGEMLTFPSTQQHRDLICRAWH